MPHTVLPMAERFWPKVQKADGDACWTWTGFIDQRGYGRFTRPRSSYPVGAHRIAYELAHGPIPEGMFVCHRCDNPPCVRPDHLFLGTPRDNVQDMFAKGRSHHWRPRVPGAYPLATHCGYGHEYTPENTYVWKGHRRCRICNARRSAESKRRREAQDDA